MQIYIRMLYMRAYAYAYKLKYGLTVFCVMFKQVLFRKATKSTGEYHWKTHFAIKF